MHFCCGRYKICKNDHITRSSDSDVLKRVSCIRARFLGPLYKEIILPDAEILSLAET